MKELDYNEFSNYFYLHAVPVLKNLEKKRRILKKLNTCYNIFGYIIGILFVIIIFGTPELANNIWLAHIYMIFQFSIVLYMAMFVPMSILKRYLRKNFSKQLYKNVLQKFELSYTNSSREKEFAAKNVRHICENSKIFPACEYIEVDDIIKGEYKGLPFTIYDVDIFYYENSRRSTSHVSAFRGIFLATKSNKSFKGETLIKTDKNSNNPKEIEQKQRVKLEDIEFENFFEVYSTDQIEARYLLTTAFMERLKNFKIQKQYPIEILFSREKYMDENVFFFFDTRKDHFEVDINKNLLDKNVLYDVLLEISEMLKVVDALKLDQNIGM